MYKLKGHSMIWTFALWFMFAVLTVLQSVTCDFGPGTEYWPYVRLPHNGVPYQSPINIVTTEAQKRYLPFLRTHGYWHFEKAEVTITNTGHTVCVRLTNDTKLVPYVMGGPLLKNKYVFEQMHFHWGKGEYGSEHEINGEKYAMEVHIVHYKTDYGSFENALKFDDGLCVLAFFGQLRRHDNPEFKAFVQDLKSITNPGDKISKNFNDEFSWLKSTSLRQHYYTYSGSLTTPEYTECVTWIVFTETIGISHNQLNAFRELVNDHEEHIIENDRQIQDLNDRIVLYAF